MGDDENGPVLEWFDKIWEAGRSSQPAQKDEDEMLGPARVQKWAANYIKSESIAVARAGEVPLPQTMDTNVYVMTTAAQAAVLANKSREDYVLPEDEHISGFVVTLALVLHQISRKNELLAPQTHGDDAKNVIDHNVCVPDWKKV